MFVSRKFNSNFLERELNFYVGKNDEKYFIIFINFISFFQKENIIHNFILNHFTTNSYNKNQIEKRKVFYYLYSIISHIIYRIKKKERK